MCVPLTNMLAAAHFFVGCCGSGGLNFHPYAKRFGDRIYAQLPKVRAWSGCLGGGLQGRQAGERGTPPKSTPSPSLGVGCLAVFLPSL